MLCQGFSWIFLFQSDNSHFEIRFQQGCSCPATVKLVSSLTSFSNSPCTDRTSTCTMAMASGRLGLGAWLVWKSEKKNKHFAARTLCTTLQGNVWGLVPPNPTSGAKRKWICSNQNSTVERVEVTASCKVLTNASKKNRISQNEDGMDLAKKKQQHIQKTQSSCVYIYIYIYFVCYVRKPTTYPYTVRSKKSHLEPRRYGGAWFPPSGRSDFEVPRTVDFWRGKRVWQGFVSHDVSYLNMSKESTLQQ